MNTGIRLTYEYVKNFFSNKGCELLEQGYKNARTKMKYRCSCGNITYIVYDSFQRGNRCKQCGDRKKKEYQIGRQFKNCKSKNLGVSKFFDLHGCKLLNNYIDSYTYLEFICKCGRSGRRTWQCFRNFPHCVECGLNKRRGKNHYEWHNDRVALRDKQLFRQRCYKLVKLSLKATGKVKDSKTDALLGYSYKDLQDHIINHPDFNKVKGSKWSIDHIFPIIAFVRYNITDLKLINCLDNLRPMLSLDNSLKSDNYSVDEFRDWLKTKGVQI
jgi:hypothetical protein